MAFTKKNIILSIDTSCDETSVAITEGTTILSNVLWSQASIHAKFGGVFPSLAQRAHQEHIDWVINKALKTAFPKSLIINNQSLIIKNIDAIAVTAGPGLAIALGVGIEKAKELSKKYNKPLIPVNHIEGHLLSPLAKPRNEMSNQQRLSSSIPDQPPISNIKNEQIKIIDQRLIFPALSLVASGKHTDLIYVNGVGDYKIIAHTADDALGESLDKTARMLGLGYPGGPVLEKLAKLGNPNSYPLPIPLLGQEDRFEFSYSGLKTAMWKLVEKEKPLSKTKIENLAASFQNVAFKHVERLTSNALLKYKVRSFMLGGGVSSNTGLRSRLRKIVKENGVSFYIPYSKKLCTDNAAMIGVAASFKMQKKDYLTTDKVDLVDRVPRAKVDQNFQWV